MGALHRIKEYIDYKGLTNQAFEKSIGFSNGAFSSQLKNNRTIGVDKLEKILIAYPEIDPIWVLTGNGNMLKERCKKVAANIAPSMRLIDQKSTKKPNYDSSREEIANIVCEDKSVFCMSTEQKIPLVSIAAVAGFGSAEFSIGERDVKAYYVVPKFKDRKIDFMIEITGSSMYPKYNSGDVVACKIIKESTFLQWNKVHVIATQEQGILIKRLKQGTDDNRLLVISDNKDYDPFEIPKDEITGLALVVGVIRLE